MTIKENKLINSDLNGSLNILKKEYSISRPTQSLLAKWLREVHNIIVTPLPTKTKWFFNIQWGGVETNYEDFDSDEYYSTYEEALEIGLQEGLKLIKTEEF